MKLVTKFEDVISAIKTLNDSLDSNPELVGRLGQAHAYYAVDDDRGQTSFGFSKFVGYAGLSARSYLANYKELDGRKTEDALRAWFEELRYGSPAYEAKFDELHDWLAQFGKKPRGGGQQKIRIMVLKPDYHATILTGDDRKLLELLVAVADTLPIHQRHELRAAL